jgi:hypothetical protein
MKDQLITFKTAKLAKEKGFNLICIDGCEYNYTEDGILLGHEDGGHRQYIPYMAPTQSLLQKWLREIHEIDVYCIPSDFETGIWYNNIASHNPVFTGSYEEVLEKGLFEALKLIKI